MARNQPDAGGGILHEGSELGGLTLRRLIAGGEFSSLWLTQPLEEGFAESCVRAIRASHFRLSDAYERLCSELGFWRRLPGCAVSLYDWGRSGEHCFLVMRYMPQGSVADQLNRESWLQENLAEFAVDFAGALCELHATSGAHGNLKPSNVFPVRGDGVLLSDFALPLWLDEFDNGCSALATRLLHPYRAPEQRQSPRDYDTRSDVYAFGLILWRCLTGAEPTEEGEPAGGGAVQWPSGLGPILERCLAADRNARPADGLELLEMLERATRHVAKRAAGGHEPGPPSAAPEAVAQQDGPSRLAEARDLIHKGLLDAALNTLEALPPGIEGMAELLDEVEAHQRACEELTEQAVHLAGMGQTAAAAEAIAEAERQWANSPTLIAVKAEVAASTGPEQSAKPDGQLRDERDRTGVEPSEALRAAVEAGKFDMARTLVEKLVRRGPLSAEDQAAIGEFKRQRVRTAFLDSIRTAKRLYVLGHHEEASRHWLEAARWLPSGRHRERLRRTAGAASRGKLRVAVQPMGAAVPAAQRLPEPRQGGQIAAGGPAATALPLQQSPEARERSRAWERRALLLLLGALGLLVGGVLALLWMLRGD